MVSKTFTDSSPDEMVPTPERFWLRVLAPVWERRWIGILVVAVLAASFGLILGLTMPRGPATTAQALTALPVSLLIGGAAGFLLRSRWAMLLAPAVFAVVYELARVGVDGPTVDTVYLSNLYGAFAFVAGRGFTGLLTLLPMVLGAAFGAGLARRVARRLGREDATEPTGPRGHGIWRVVRQLTAAVTAIALIALAVLIARPPGTDPISSVDGTTTVAELAAVRIGGHRQTVMIRGADIDAPVVLYLAGGPGGTDIGAMRLFGAGLEQDFVVATWDQRGAGTSYPALDPTSTLTLDQAVRDTLEVTDYLRDRFDEQKIYLVGNSWGTIIGVLAAQQRPAAFHAFVGAGQMVSPLATDRMFYDDTLAYADRTGDAALAETLRDIGPPPYADLLDYVPAVFTGERLWNDYPGQDGRTEMPANLLVREYSLLDQIHSIGATLDTFSVLYPQLQGIDFRVDVPTLQVPVYLVEGRHEARGRAVLAEEWFTMLQAPTKQLIMFENSGHRPQFEEPELFQRVMLDTVLAQTRSG